VRLGQLRVFLLGGVQLGQHDRRGVRARRQELRRRRPLRLQPLAVPAPLLP
jgi:hypothetical protein